ncbi:MAG: hypothetical protein LBP53_01710 [Candidatus Peribacteria bacterium]|nr:hypothetical protein [Candidatus Peribacteria bacterium]
MKKIMLISGIVIVAFIGVVYFTISTSPSPTQETLPPIQEMRILAEDIQENNLYIAKF